MSGGESKFQTKVIQVLSAQGLLVQKFNDLFAEGIPDMLAELPVTVPVPASKVTIWDGLWLEAKCILELPKRASSPWPKKYHPSAAQMGWMKRWNRGAKPCTMLIKTPHGWACVPYAQIPAFFSRPHTATVDLFTEEAPTYGALCRSYERCKSKLA